MTAQSKHTTHSAFALDKHKLGLGLNIGLAILLIVTIFSLMNGHRHGESAWDAIHCLAGTMLLFGCALHLALHENWIKAVALNTPKNMSPSVRRSRQLFYGLLIAFIVCGLSGFATLIFSHGLAHLLLPLLCLWARIHDLSGMIFLGLNLYHMALHRKWVSAKIGKSLAPQAAPRS